MGAGEEHAQVRARAEINCENGRVMGHPLGFRCSKAINASAALRVAQCHGVRAPGIIRSTAIVRYSGTRWLASRAQPRGAGPRPGAPISISRASDVFDQDQCLAISISGFAKLETAQASLFLQMKCRLRFLFRQPLNLPAGAGIGDEARKHVERRFPVWPHPE